MPSPVRRTILLLVLALGVAGGAAVLTRTTAPAGATSTGDRSAVTGGTATAQDGPAGVGADPSSPATAPAAAPVPGAARPTLIPQPTLAELAAIAERDLARIAAARAAQGASGATTAATPAEATAPAQSPADAPRVPRGVQVLPGNSLRPQAPPLRKPVLPGPDPLDNTKPVDGPG